MKVENFVSKNFIKKDHLKKYFIEMLVSENYVQLYAHNYPWLGILDLN